MFFLFLSCFSFFGFGRNMLRDLVFVGDLPLPGASPPAASGSGQGPSAPGGPGAQGGGGGGQQSLDHGQPSLGHGQQSLGHGQKRTREAEDVVGLDGSGVLYSMGSGGMVAPVAPAAVARVQVRDGSGGGGGHGSGNNNNNNTGSGSHYGHVHTQVQAQVQAQAQAHGLEYGGLDVSMGVVHGGGRLNTSQGGVKLDPLMYEQLQHLHDPMVYARGMGGTTAYEMLDQGQQQQRHPLQQRQQQHPHSQQQQQQQHQHVHVQSQVQHTQQPLGEYHRPLDAETVFRSLSLDQRGSSVSTRPEGSLQPQSQGPSRDGSSQGQGRGQRQAPTSPAGEDVLPSLDDPAFFGTAGSELDLDGMNGVQHTFDVWGSAPSGFQCVFLLFIFSLVVGY